MTPRPAPHASRLPRKLLAIAEDIRSEGGRALVVGGWVRDQMVGRASKDVDVEVFGLGVRQLEQVLARHGELLRFGKCFEVYRIRRLAVDFSLPRSGFARTGFSQVAMASDASGFAEASRWRDLTINALGLDLCTGELLDPHGGTSDITRQILRATDPDTFGLDPLRVLRVAQLAARLRFSVDSDLVALCRTLPLDGVPAERVFEELKKLLLLPERPSVGFQVLLQMGQLGVFPEIQALVGVPQDPTWHQEGDVFTHTLLVVDEAACLRCGDAYDAALMFGALCHDLGKPTTTTHEADRIRSLGHDKAGAPLAEQMLRRLNASHELAAQVATLVRYHLAPASFVQQQASDRAYRRLARKLAATGVSMELLARLARADRRGRGGGADRRRADDKADDKAFLTRAAALAVRAAPPGDVVLGRHLVARGLKPGPQFSEVLARCRDYQDSTGCTDVDIIVRHVLGS